MCAHLAIRPLVDLAPDQRNADRMKVAEAHGTNAPGDSPTRLTAKFPLVAHWRAVLAIVVSLVLVAAGVAGYQWRNGLHVFKPAGMAHGSQIVHVGKTYYADAYFATSPHAGTVDLRSASPHVTTNTAHAHLKVMSCHKGTVNALGAWAKPVFCADRPVAFRPGNHTFGDDPGKITLLIRFTLPSPGRFAFNGIDVSYTAGWRHGAQRTGIVQHYRTLSPR